MPRDKRAYGMSLINLQIAASILGLCERQATPEIGPCGECKLKSPKISF